MAHSYFRSVILVSILIMVYQGIANSDLAIISQLTHQNGNNWAGPLSIALLFTGSGLSSLYNKYIGKYPFKICFFIGSFGYTLFIAIGLIFMKLGFNVTVQVLIFIVSFTAGCICSIFYNTQFNYINTLAKIDKKQVQYFGINMAFAQSSNIIGNLISSLIIEPLDQFTSVLVFQIIIFCTSLCFLFVKDPKKQQINENLIKDGHTNQQNQNRIAALSPKQTIISQILIENSCQKNNNNITPLSVCCSFSFSGIIIAFIYCQLSILLYETFEDKMSEVELNRLSFVIFIFEGIGELLGGLFMIFMSHKIKDVPFMIILMTTCFMASLFIIWMGSYYQNAYVIGLGVVITGFSDCACFVLGLSLAGLWHQKGISTFNISQSLTVAATVMFVVFVPFYISIVWITLFYLWNFIALQVYRRRSAKEVQPQ